VTWVGRSVTVRVLLLLSGLGAFSFCGRMSPVAPFVRSWFLEAMERGCLVLVANRVVVAVEVGERRGWVRSSS